MATLAHLAASAHMKDMVASMTSRHGCLFPVATLLAILLVPSAWLVWRASDRSLPPVARGLDPNFADGDVEFKRRIQVRYPIGMAEGRLVSDLRTQGFAISRRPARPSSAELRRFIGCGNKVWQVLWRAKDGKVTEVRSVYGANCL